MCLFGVSGHFSFFSHTQFNAIVSRAKEKKRDQGATKADRFEGRGAIHKYEGWERATGTHTEGQLLGETVRDKIGIHVEQVRGKNLGA